MICNSCGRVVEYSGELSEAALSMLGMTRFDAIKEENPDGKCDGCRNQDAELFIEELANAC